MVETLPEANGAQGLRCPLPSLLRGQVAGVQQRQLDVFERARSREQVEALKDEPDVRVAYLRQLAL